MSYKTHIAEDNDGLEVRCDIMPYDVCGKIVSMSENGCGLFSRNRFDLWDKLELHVLVKDESEKCIVTGVISNVAKKGKGRTDGVDDKDDGWVYNIDIQGEHEKWKDVAFQYQMAHR